MTSLPINQIIHGDCLQVMKGWPDKCIDLIVTDPPYGMSYVSNHYRAGNPYGPIIGDNEYPAEALEHCLRLARVAVLSFCRWDNLYMMPKPTSFIAWIKNNWTAGDLYHAYAKQWEGIAFWACAQHAFLLGRPSDVINNPRVPATSLYHPTEKPLGLLGRILSQHIGNLILDPFCGSGTTCVAAKMLGRDYIGIDISEKYCEIARQRLRAVDTGVSAKELMQGQIPLFEEPK